MQSTRAILFPLLSLFPIVSAGVEPPQDIHRCMVRGVVEGARRKLAGAAFVSRWDLRYYFKFEHYFLILRGHSFFVHPFSWLSC